MADFAEEETDYQEGDTGEELYGEESGINDNAHTGSDEAEPEQFKMRVLEMEEELEKLTKMQQQVENQITSASDKIDENSM